MRCHRLRRPRFSGCAPSLRSRPCWLQSLGPRGVSYHPPWRCAGVGGSSPLARLWLAHPKKTADARSASEIPPPCGRLPLVDGQCRPVSAVARSPRGRLFHAVLPCQLCTQSINLHRFTTVARWPGCARCFHGIKPLVSSLRDPLSIYSMTPCTTGPPGSSSRTVKVDGLGRAEEARENRENRLKQTRKPRDGSGLEPGRFSRPRGHQPRR